MKRENYLSLPLVVSNMATTYPHMLLDTTRGKERYMDVKYTKDIHKILKMYREKLKIKKCMFL